MDLCTHGISWAGKLASTIYKGALHTAPIRVFGIPYLPFMLHVMGPQAWRGDQTTGTKVGSPLLSRPSCLTLGLWGLWRGQNGPDCRGEDGRQTDIQFGLSPPESTIDLSKNKNKTTIFIFQSSQIFNSVSCQPRGKSKRLHSCNILQRKIIIINDIKCV